MRIQTNDDFVAVISNFDVLSARSFEIDTLRHLLFLNKVLVLRGQRLPVDAYEAFMKNFGEPVPHVLSQYCLPEHRNVLIISNLVSSTGVPCGVTDGGGYWHTDMSYQTKNDVVTSLYCVSAPPNGWETQFVDCVAGLIRLRSDNQLSAELADLLSASAGEVVVEHNFGNRQRRRDPTAPHQRLTHKQASTFIGVMHPLVYVHPVTSSESLYAIAGTSMRIAGREQEDGIRVLDSLQDSLLRRAPTYLHRYEVGDLLIWDNLTTLHRGVGGDLTNDANQCRCLYRMNLDYAERKL